METYVEMVEAGVYVEETGWDTYIGGMNTGRVAGAISTWLPAAESTKYEEPMEFFNNQPVFSMITSYSANVPECVTGAIKG